VRKVPRERKSNFVLDVEKMCIIVWRWILWMKVIIMQTLTGYLHLLNLLKERKVKLK
jgi:hypothetical protein